MNMPKTNQKRYFNTIKELISFMWFRKRIYWPIRQVYSEVELINGEEMETYYIQYVIVCNKPPKQINSKRYLIRVSLPDADDITEE